MDILLWVILSILSPYIAFFGIIVALIGVVVYGTVHPVEISNAMDNIMLYGALSAIRVNDSTVLSLRQPISKMFDFAFKWILIISIIALIINITVTLFLNFRTNLKTVVFGKVIFSHILLMTVLSFVPLLVLKTILLGLYWFLPIPMGM